MAKWDNCHYCGNNADRKISWDNGFDFEVIYVCNKCREKAPSAEIIKSLGGTELCSCCGYPFGQLKNRQETEPDAIIQCADCGNWITNDEWYEKFIVICEV